MIKSSKMLSSGNQLMQNIDGENEIRLRLQQFIDGALQSIRRQRLLLRQVRDDGYDVALAEQQWQRLAGLQDEVQQLVDSATELEPSVQDVLQQKSAVGQSFLQEWMKDSGDTERDDKQMPEKRELKQQLQAVIVHLQGVVSDIEAGFGELDGAETEIESKREMLAQFRESLEWEKQIIAVGDLGRSHKAVLLKQLHQLTLLVYRLRQLVFEPRLQKRLGQLEGVVLQVKDTVDGLDVEASHIAELLDDSIEVLEQRLSRFEYDRRLLWVPLPFSWFVNRYRDVARMKSIQGRVLSGLGFSLSLSAVTFVVFTVILTVVSGYASSSEDGLRGDLEEKQNALVTDVGAFLEENRKKKEIEAQIASLQVQNKIVDSQSRGKQLQLSETGDDRVINKVDLDKLQREQSAQTETQINLFNQKNELEPALERSLEFIAVQIKEIRDLETTLSSYQKKSPDSRLNKILSSLASFINDQGILNHSRRVLLAAFSGALGSMMSILIRLDQMEKEDIKNPFLLGALKPLIGAVFGIAVFAVLSTRVIDILPSSFYLYERRLSGDIGEAAPVIVGDTRDPLGDLDSQELYKIFLVAFLAGFSERLANDTLKSVGSSRSLG